MIILIAPIFTEKILNKYRATSPAASKWCSTFAKHLAKYEEVVCISAINCSMFPKGVFKIEEERYNKPVRTKMVSYINIPLYRISNISKKIIKEIDILNKKNNISYVITYNKTKVNIKIGKYLNKKNIKWASLYADANRNIDLVSNADFHIYFSYDAYIRSKYNNKYNYEGGIYDFVPKKYEENRKSIILYTGAIRKENGIDIMIEAFKKIENKDAKLLICGKGMYNEFKNRIENDKRIEYLGLVSKKYLNILYKSATAFINPRLSKYKENNNNFPSKLLDYFSYGKPIISTDTKGINPKYKKMMYLIKNENSDSIKKAIEHVLNLSKAEKIEVFERIKIFSITENSWDINTNMLKIWMKKVGESYEKRKKT